MEHMQESYNSYRHSTGWGRMDGEKNSPKYNWSFWCFIRLNTFIQIADAWCKSIDWLQHIFTGLKFQNYQIIWGPLLQSCNALASTFCTTFVKVSRNQVECAHRLVKVGLKQKQYLVWWDTPLMFCMIIWNKFSFPKKINIINMDNFVNIYNIHI